MVCAEVLALHQGLRAQEHVDAHAALVLHEREILRDPSAVPGAKVVVTKQAQSLARVPELLPVLLEHLEVAVVVVGYEARVPYSAQQRPTRHPHRDLGDRGRCVGGLQHVEHHGLLRGQGGGLRGNRSRLRN